MKIKISKSQWEKIGKKAGWMKTAQIINDDGFADGGARYTDEEMDLMERQDKRDEEIKRIKEEMSKVISEFSHNLLSKEGFELRLRELIEKMYIAKGTKPDPNVE
jgi:hypothetical protein